MSASAVETVSLWHHLLNSDDQDGMLALVATDVEVSGPRGMGRGAKLVAEWFARAGVRLVPIRLFHRGKLVVVEAEGSWRRPDGDPPACSQVVWTLFAVDAGVISRIVRFENLAAALGAGGLTEADVKAETA